MALGQGCVFELRSGGDDLNGGGFDPTIANAGTDRSQQTSPHVTIDGATITATVHSTTTQITLVGYTVTAADIGNMLRISGGTALANTYEINTVDVPNNRWTLDKSAGTAAQTVQGRMGGCRKFLGSMLNSTQTWFPGECVIWVKNDGAYTLTSTTPGDGGPCNSTAGCRIEGYLTTRGDRGSPPVFDAGVLTGFTFHNMTAASGQMLLNIAFNGNGNATVVGVTLHNRMVCYLVKVSNCTTGFTAGTPLNCYAYNCSTVGFTSDMAVGCMAESCAIGFNVLTHQVSCCMAVNCTGDGFTITPGGIAVNCVAYGCGGDGFDMAGNGACANCIATNNTGFGYRGSANVHVAKMWNCARYNNTAGATTGVQNFDENPITLTGDPFTNAASKDFSLNNAAGGGLLCKGVGLDPYLQTHYGDVGAVQHNRTVSYGGAG